MNNSGVSGKYKVVIHKGNPEEPTKVVDWFSNLITNQGLDAIATKGIGKFNYCKVGSGNTTPAVTDVGLVNPLGSVSYSSVTYGFTTTAPFYTWARMAYTFPPGNAVGNISELSIGWDTTNASAFSRALITENGSPITITVLPDDYLTVYYEYRIYPNLNDVTGTITIGDTTHTFTGRASGVGTVNWQGSYYILNEMISLESVIIRDGNIGTVFSNPTYTQTDTKYGGGSSPLYVPGSYYRDITFTLGVNEGNLTNFIKSIMLDTNVGYFQYEFTPVIQKTINNSLTLTFRFSWGRYV